MALTQSRVLGYLRNTLGVADELDAGSALFSSGMLDSSEFWAHAPSTASQRGLECPSGVCNMPARAMGFFRRKRKN